MYAFWVVVVQWLLEGAFSTGVVAARFVPARLPHPASAVDGMIPTWASLGWRAGQPFVRICTPFDLF
ncbi:MAG: hypothetical protein ACMUIU_17140 [bacterium]